MRPPHRPRTGTRRDGLVRAIDSREVRYPGVDHPAIEQHEYEAWKTGGRTLRPTRDTGLAIEGRLARERRRRARQRRQRAVAIAVAMVVVAVLALGWRQDSDAQASRDARASVAQPLARRSTGADPSVGQLRALNAAPTPIVASYRKLSLRLPVRLNDLTEIGFHQAAYGYATHLKTPMPAADMKAAKKLKTTGRDLTKQERVSSAPLTGSALIMWRNRPGKPDSAMDVGAKPGSDVLAPVSGVVIKVKRYFLYGKHEDYEIHIQPTGYPNLDCVLIHVTDIGVEPGTDVSAGISRLGAVRKLSDRVTHQLGHYTRGGGDHTHVQLNDATDPNYKGLQGAIAVDGS